MSCFSVKMMAAGPLPSFPGSTTASASVKPPTLPPTLQVRVKDIQQIELSEKKSMNVTRRDLALFLTAASFSAVTLSSPKPAEAAMSRAEMKKMILEKFKIFREKVGLSKPETEEKDKTELSKPETKKNEKIELSKPETTKNEKVKLSKPETKKNEKIELSKPATKKNEKIASPAPLIAEKKLPLPQAPILPNIQNDKKIVVEAAPLP